VQVFVENIVKRCLNIYIYQAARADKIFTNDQIYLIDGRINWCKILNFVDIV